MRDPLRAAVLAVVLAIAAAACSSGGDIDKLKQDIQRKEGEKASDAVRPPSTPDPNLTARVGLIVATNSPAWPKLLKSPADNGVVVLFIQPRGPSENAGIEVGDVITEVDQKPVSNAERAVVVLRSRPDQRRTLALAKRDGTRKTVSIQAKRPENVSLLSLYNPMIQQNPNDPVVRFLRAQAGGPFDASLADADKAIELAPDFIEAISLRGELRWNRARDAKLAANQVDELRNLALSDWGLALRLDPDNTRVLVSRSQALSQLGNAASARADAQKARAADTTFPGAHYALALADFGLGRYTTSAEPARTAIDLNPYDVRYYRMLAFVFMRLNRKADAQKTVDAILPLVDKNDAKTRNDLKSILGSNSKSAAD